MYAKYPNIVIVGVQTSENGPIQWSKDLPNTCLLSLGIKKHITPLLAGLLEVNPQKMWTFEKFFSEVTRILSKKKIHIYFMTKLTEHRVYLDKEEKLDQFQLLLNQVNSEPCIFLLGPRTNCNFILQQTEVSPSSQILIYDKLLLGHYVDDSTPGTSFPDTTRAYPILLFSKENHNVSLGIDKVRSRNIILLLTIILLCLLTLWFNIGASSVSYIAKPCVCRK